MDHPDLAAETSGPGILDRIAASSTWPRRVQTTIAQERIAALCEELRAEVNALTGTVGRPVDVAASIVGGQLLTLRMDLQEAMRNADILVQEFGPA